MAHREEVINVKLADGLAERGLEANAETILAKGRPDVLVNLNGVKLVVEGRHHKQKKGLHTDARTRIQKGIGEISLAVEYSDDLYEGTTAALSGKLGKATFDGCLFYFAASDIQEKHFAATNLDDLAALIRNAFLLIVQNDVVRTQVNVVEQAIDKAVDHATRTTLFFKSATVQAKLKAALAISEQTSKAKSGEEEE